MDLANNLNTPRLVADSTGTTVWKWDNQEPFGGDTPNGDPGNTGIPFSLPLRISRYYSDAENGLLYAYYRDCLDPATGRFCQPDPIGAVLLEDMAFRALGSIAPVTPGLRGVLSSRMPHGNHLYDYALQDPLATTDPLGLDPLSRGNRDRERADRDRPGDPTTPTPSATSGAIGLSAAQLAQCKACRDDSMKKCLVGGGVCAVGACGLASVSVAGGFVCAAAASSVVGGSCWYLTDLYCSSACTVK